MLFPFLFQNHKLCENRFQSMVEDTWLAGEWPDPGRLCEFSHAHSLPRGRHWGPGSSVVLSYDHLLAATLCAAGSHLTEMFLKGLKHLFSRICSQGPSFPGA